MNKTKEMPEMRIWFTTSLGYFCCKTETFPLKNAPIYTTYLSAMCQSLLCQLQLPEEDLMEQEYDLSVSTSTTIFMQYIDPIDNFHLVLSSKSL